MKKCVVMMISVCMLGVLALSGCGSADDSAAGENTVKQSAAENSGDAKASSGGYVFMSDGVEIGVDMDMAPIAEALGEPGSYFEEPSCAAEGIAKQYGYGSFVIETYPDGDNDLVCSIVLKDDSVATPEGIDLSMTRDDIIETYGEDYEESGSSIVYEKNGMKLLFIMDGDNIVSIEYDSAVLG